MEIFQSFEPLLRVFWFIAIPASIIFIIQTILTFIGADATDGLDADFDSNLEGGDSTFQLFSLRNLINFLLGFSWGGISFYSTIENKTLLVTVAFAIGASFIFLFFVVIQQLQKLAEDNSFRIEMTLNKTAEVYLTIPEKKSGQGKILVSVNGAFHELPAMTENEKIPSSTLVKIVKIENNNIPIVEKI